MTPPPAESTQVQSGIEKLLTIDGVQVRTSVRGQGRPLLLINGIGSNIEMWEPLRCLLDDFRTIAFDAPGTGVSQTPRWPRRMRSLASMINQLLEALDHPQVDVFGFSFGGMLAQQLVRDHPRRVRRMVLAATTPGVGGVLGDPQALRVLATARRFRSPTYLNQVAPIIYGGRVASDPEFLESQRHARGVHPPTNYGYASQLAATIGWSSMPWLHRVNQPTLVLAGEEDPTTPAVNARLIAATMPHAELHILPASGHLFPLDTPDLVAPLVRDFLL